MPITLQEAIKILVAEAEVCIDHKQFKHADAKQLAIEALKRVKSQRADKRFMASMPLPGETHD
jgi:hypothetical protein